MRFSDAIRIGCLLHPKGIMWAARKHGSVFRTCALGAAGEGSGLAITDCLTTGGVLAHLRPIWPELENRDAVNPVRGGVGARYQIIWQLNDIDDWTREAIADWYEENFEVKENDRICERAVSTTCVNETVGV